MTHPAIDDAAAARIRAQLDQPGSTPGDVAAAAETTSGPRPVTEPKPTAVAKAKASARKAAVPVIARLRQELDRAGAEDLAELRAEVARLRDELVRTRAEHSAELAAIHEELAATRPVHH